MGDCPSRRGRQESSRFWWKREVCWLWNPIRKSVFGAKRGCCFLVCVRSLWTLFKVKTGHTRPSDLCICVSTGPNQGWMATCACECASVRGRCVSATEVTYTEWHVALLWPFTNLPPCSSIFNLVYRNTVCISSGQMWPVFLCGNPQFRQTGDWLILSVSVPRHTHCMCAHCRYSVWLRNRCSFYLESKKIFWRKWWHFGWQTNFKG